ncbi:MAG: hypothetical protein ACRD35_04385, partial [Candidatus Acidiferrales bacterium]
MVTPEQQAEQLADAEEPPGSGRCAERNTPGVHFELRETGRQRSGHVRGVTEVTYDLVTSDFPAGKVFQLYIWSIEINRPLPFFKGKTADESGKLDPVSHSIDSFMRGEWMELSTLSTDGSVRACSRRIPFPLEARDNRCRVWLEVMNREATIFRVYAEGFEPNEELLCRWRSD